MWYVPFAVTDVVRTIRSAHRGVVGTDLFLHLRLERRKDDPLQCCVIALKVILLPRVVEHPEGCAGLADARGDRWPVACRADPVHQLLIHVVVVIVVPVATTEARWAEVSDNAIQRDTVGGRESVHLSPVMLLDLRGAGISTLPYLWPALPVFQVVSTMQNVWEVVALI